MNRSFYLWMLGSLFPCILTAQWELIYPPYANANSLYHITKPVKGDHFLAFGTNKVIIDDQGMQLEVDTNYHLAVNFKNELATTHSPAPRTDVFFLTNDIGYLLDRNKIYKTINGGKNWQPVLELAMNASNFPSSAHFEALHFVDENLGFAVGWFDKIFRTKDGGQTWDTLRWSNSSAPFQRLKDVHFVNEQIGFAVGYDIDDFYLNIGGYRPYLLRTTDGGDNWTPSFPYDRGEYHPGSVQFLDEQIGYMLLTDQNLLLPNDVLLKTENGGEHWDPVSTPAMLLREMSWLNDSIGFLIGGYGYAFGGDNIIARTSDGGKHWEEITLDTWPGFGMNHCFDIAFNSQGIGIVVGTGGSVYTSDDKGRSWNALSFGLPETFDLHFPNENKGFAVGHHNLLLRTDDGQNWNIDPSFPIGGTNDIHFIDDQKGFVLGSEGLYQTEDGGMQWDYVDGNFQDTFLYEMDIANQEIWAIGRPIKDEQLYFQKRGLNDAKWFTAVLDTTGKAVSVQQLKKDYGIVATERKLFFTENGGNNWEPIFSIPENDPNNNYFGINSVAFFDSEIGLISTVSGHILRTEDRGNQWTPVFPFPDSYTVNSLSIINDTLAYAFGSFVEVSGEYFQGKLYRTEDAGMSWEEEKLPFLIENGIRSMAKGGRYLYITGGYGVILRKEIAPLSTSIPVEEKAKLQEIMVYPNPVIEKLHIQLDYANPAVITLEIFDSTGRSIFQQIMEVLGGNLQETISVKSFEPGWYTLRLTTDTNTLIEPFIKR